MTGGRTGRGTGSWMVILSLRGTRRWRVTDCGLVTGCVLAILSQMAIVSEMAASGVRLWIVPMKFPRAHEMGLVCEAEWVLILALPLYHL